MATGSIWGINGAVIHVLPEKNTGEFFISERVCIGEKQLAGEVVSLRRGASGEMAVVQVYESTSGLRPNEKVYGTGQPLSICLAPVWVGHIFDGIGRQLDKVQNGSVPGEKKWAVRLLVKEGDYVPEGGIFAEVTETQAITYRAMLPPYISGKIRAVAKNGMYTIDENLIEIEGAGAFPLKQDYPVRTSRPVRERLPLIQPLITGQRVIDSLFPIAKGGVAAMPGGFGTGKTMTQHQLTKWCDADLIVYIGCGERGNEMAQVLEEFAQLTDPRTGASMLARTILIANTSDMPVAAREASIYTGLAVAEGYCSMGYHVAVMADSTSRWAEALREISGRLQEMPAEEGYPAYLASRLAAFYQRAGYFENRNGTRGSITIIGAVSPQGADFSEPVTVNTKRFVRCFWALDRRLAYGRHFPAINWNDSYSDYVSAVLPANVIENRRRILEILTEEGRILEIAKLVGTQDLPQAQQEILHVAKIIRETFLQQNAYNAADAYTPFAKQVEMLDALSSLIAKGGAL
ncbi:MAG: V-type ATP synthase subunit A [Defluviitaleaceae bacterium]|nr:V-type ATP synthase subunit A [Defluviitaleaceae bacterium]MCL2276232.1 V-type ATP synthase subunit A [Defluviitaleaceae bacterium]